MTETMYVKHLSTQDAIHNMTLKVVVHHKNITRLRFWVGCNIIKLAAIVIGCGINIEKENNR